MKTLKIILGLAAAIIIAGGLWWMNNTASGPAPTVQGVDVTKIAVDYKNATYVVGEQPVTLVNGRAEVSSVPGSASKTVTQYFGNEAMGDLNGDGVPDIAFLLTQSTGGTGTFFYAVAALKTQSGYQGTNGILLGDRIAPQTTQIKNGQVVVNYADRKSGEPMSAKPSLGVTKYLKVTGETLAEARKISGAGERCGGNMTTAPICAEGFHCAPEPGSHLPFGDVGGTCVAN